MQRDPSDGEGHRTDSVSSRPAERRTADELDRPLISRAGIGGLLVVFAVEEVRQGRLKNSARMYPPARLDRLHSSGLRAWYRPGPGHDHPLRPGHAARVSAA